MLSSIREQRRPHLHGDGNLKSHAVKIRRISQFCDDAF